MQSTNISSILIEQLTEALSGAEAILIGAGAGLSTSAGFAKERLFYTQGDYGLRQCSVPCHESTYDNEAAVRQMVAEQHDMRIPSDLIPYCPRCGKPMTMNLRSDSTFVEDAGWHRAAQRYADFLAPYKDGSILFLELGVGPNTPGIIKYPFWHMAAGNPHATYVCINYGEADCPSDIRDRSICIDADIRAVLEAVQRR